MSMIKALNILDSMTINEIKSLIKKIKPIRPDIAKLLNNYLGGIK